MNREILFRGKRVDNGEWIKEDLITTPFIRNTTQQNIIYILDITKADYDCFEDLTEDNGIFEVDPETVCQHTGLTDKNGRKIFEGDIVRDIFNSSVVGIVRYGEYQNTFNDDEYGGHVGFYIEWKEREYHLRKDLVYWVKNSEFIGNIFDNPELLEGESNEQ